MSLKFMFAGALALPLFAAGAQAGVWGGHSNDTGGIIPWSPATAHVYRDIAAEKCSHWDKIAIITSVHRVYGDYVGFSCIFPPGYDPNKRSRETIVRVRY